MTETQQHDVAIIGGGPGGATLGSLLRKYDPAIRVGIVEKEVFPRDHVGESQLPPISSILAEMGCWDKVEAAGFPVKIGATYTWGKTREPWVFEFLPEEHMRPGPRPQKYEGWRVQTAFQVDRAIYDKILLDHAASMGCEVREGVRVAGVRRDGDRVLGLSLEDGSEITAKHYVDATGSAAILRRAMGVQVTAPTKLRNVAFWDYWESPHLAAMIPPAAARVHIRSLPYGWLWFIIIGQTRASVGLVTTADYYRKCGKRPEELYHESVRLEPTIQPFLEGAVCRGKTESTTDWSFVVDRTYGENWFLVGEAAGFADPILAAGLTLTQSGARELAYTILELERGGFDRRWLLDRYDELQIRRVRQHMKFADYWYSANGVFSDIQENCTEIAREAGLKLNPREAFRWLSFGGLGDDIPGQVGIGGLDVAGMKQVMLRFTGQPIDWTINGKNTFKLNLAGARKTVIGNPEDGRIVQAECWVRGEKRLPLVGVQAVMVRALERSSDIEELMGLVRAELSAALDQSEVQVMMQHAMQTLEVMVNDYWALASVRKGRPVLTMETPLEGERIHTLAPTAP